MLINKLVAHLYYHNNSKKKLRNTQCKIDAPPTDVYPELQEPTRRS